MKEYKLKFVGIRDLIIISPKVLETFIPHIYSSKSKELEVDIEEVMPRTYSDYLMELINTNRGIRGFEYRDICADVLVRRHIYQILLYQLQSLTMDEGKCFHTICLQERRGDRAGLDMECNEPFYWACKDSKSVFRYFDEFGKQMKLTVEYGDNRVSCQKSVKNYVEL